MLLDSYCAECECLFADLAVFPIWELVRVSGADWDLGSGMKATYLLNALGLWQAPHTCGNETCCLSAPLGENINICWSPDGQTIAVGNKDDVVTFIDAKTHRSKAEEQFKFEVNEISWNNDNNMFFLTNGNGCINILRWVPGQLVGWVPGLAVRVRFCHPRQSATPHAAFGKSHTPEIPSPVVGMSLSGMRLPHFQAGLPVRDPEVLSPSPSPRGFQRCRPALSCFTQSPRVFYTPTQPPPFSHCVLPSPFISAATRS